MDIVEKYKPDEVQRFAVMFAELQMCYRARVDAIGDPGLAWVPDNGLGDVLGELFMALGLGNDRAGQFFTPYSVSMLMAMMTIGDGASVRERGFVTLQEPACGSAGMVVAAAQAMHQVGLNYPEALHATCVDIDQRCVHMAYVQLSLLGIPAIVVHGNALSLDVWGVWYTPAHVMLGWGRKLRRRREAEAESNAAGYADLPDGGSEPQSASVDVQDARSGASEVVSIHETLPCAMADEEGDIAVAIEVDREEVQPDTEPSIAALFEQLSGQGMPAKAEATIFDRIEQMTLF